MDDDAIRLRREPPLYAYRGHNVVIMRNVHRCYEAYINGHRLRAPDVLPLEFISYDAARKCAEQTIDRVLARSKLLS
jgi:hypothetical protein